MRIAIVRESRSRMAHASSPSTGIKNRRNPHVSLPRRYGSGASPGEWHLCCHSPGDTGGRSMSSHTFSSVRLPAFHGGQSLALTVNVESVGAASWGTRRQSVLQSFLQTLRARALRQEHSPVGGEPAGLKSSCAAATFSQATLSCKTFSVDTERKSKVSHG